MKSWKAIAAGLIVVTMTTTPLLAQEIYVLVDTNQTNAYDAEGNIISPAPGEAFYGQDAHYDGVQPSYQDNGDDTVTDLNTGLVWAQNQSSETMSWNDASRYCERLTTGEYNNWRMPTVKELWSIRDFSTGWPWLDTDYFNLSSDGTSMNQHHSWTSNAYLVESEYQNEQVEGNPYWIVNDWTGHIKAMSGRRYVRAVRGVETYGINDFLDNGDGTVTDNATGLMWSQDDNGEHLYWEEALAYAETATVADYDDWRLPNIKELQSIADYSVTEIPALDTSVFNLTEVTNIVDGTIEQPNYPFYWSSTSNPAGAISAWFLAVGYNVDMNGYDLHGAGSICFGSKNEENSGIEDSVDQLVRLVRDTAADPTPTPSSPILDSGDYNGDGTDDVAIFRSSSGLWAVRGLTRAYFGSSSDIPAPGDYDGDEITDIGIFRGSSGLWAVRGVTRVYYGSTDDIPVPFSPNPSSACIPGIFRETSGLWALRGLTRVYFGSSGDRPVPGDYDGDGTKEIGIFRGSSGLWAIRDLTRVYFGSLTDTSIPGDYDGDGAWEAGIYRPASGLWAIRGVTRSYFGASTDDPVPADYNGDGADDTGIFRDSSGLWAIRGISRVYYGSSGDTPVVR